MIEKCTQPCQSGCLSIWHGTSGGRRRRKPAVAVNIWNRGQQTVGGPPVWGFGKRLRTCHHTIQYVVRCYTGSWICKDSLDDIHTGKWSDICNFKWQESCTSGPMMTAVGESNNYNSDIMWVHEVRQNNSSTEKADNYTFLCGNENKYHQLWTRFFIQKGIISAV